MSELSTVNDDVPETVWEHYSTHIIGLIVIAVIGLGTVVYRSLEGWSWVDSFYFSVVTLTTVGYGDLAPSSSGSKLFTAVYLLSGLSLLGAALNEMGKRRRRKRVARRTRRQTP